VLVSVHQDVDGSEKEVRYYLAEALVPTVLGEHFHVLDKLSGRDLVGKEYEPLLPYAGKTVAASG
jgi:isoleucyl-tRNA synthetase